MAHIFIHHQVTDDDAWRPTFDGDASNRSDAGITDVAVVRDAADPNSVRMVFEGDPTVVEPLLADPDRAAAMQASGVISEPKVWIS